MNTNTKPVITDTTHLVSLLFTLAKQGITLDDLSPKGQKILRRHLAACEQCKRQLAQIHPSDTLLDADPLISESQEATEPDDDELSMYAAMLETEGELSAQAAYPAIARHVAGCARCQKQVADDCALIRSCHPSPQEAAEPVIAIPEQPLPIWNEPDPCHRMLAGSFTITTKRQWVHVMSPLPAISIETAYTGSVTYLADGDAVPQQEEQFTIDLRDSQTAPSQPWLRLTLYLRALWSGSLLCKLTTALVTDEPSMEDTAEGVAWRIETVDKDGVRTAASAGVTRDDGRSNITFPLHGACLCCVDWLGITWEIPFAINNI